MDSRLKVGDLVSRLGRDLQVVESINEVGDLIDVRCVVSDGTVFEVGDRECNLACDYDLIATTDDHGFWVVVTE